MRHANLYFLIACFAWSSPAFACEPCAKRSLEESIAGANLIVQGTVTGDVSAPDSSAVTHITVAVHKVLKGTWSSTTMTLPVAYGICGYGFNDAKGDNIFLIKNHGEANGGLTTVFMGCGAKTLPAEKNEVLIDPETKTRLSIKMFTKKYIKNASPSHATTNNR